MNNYSTLLKFGGANYSIYRAIKENEADNEDLNLSLGEHFKHAAYGALDTNWILTSGKLLMHFTIAQPLIEDL